VVTAVILSPLILLEETYLNGLADNDDVGGIT
jgi:hypothetical protein